MNKIVFTGGGTAGHVTPNLAVMAKLRERGWEIHYIGSRNGIEREIVEHEGVPFHPIASGKLRRYFDLKNFKDPFRVALGVGQAYGLLRRLKPHIVFSKGGFVSVPVIVACRLAGVPVISHESDLTPGLANKISMPFASRICVTFPETLQYVRSDKAECTGLPIREQILQGAAARGLSLCGFHSQKPVLLVMGGSLGAQRINQTVRASLDTLLQRYQIIHICGKGHVDPTLAGKRGYSQFEYVKDELPDLLAAADLVVSRAGSTSIFEFLALNKPMLLIPLSRAASRGDQILNANSFQSQGYAHVLFEEDLSADALVSGISALYDERDAMKRRMADNPYGNGTETIVRLLEALKRSGG
ncbi:undecaprenyldiphospho-muramoylpentapeptide beta-N-acetylglucosaminyltransferase [Paenibacillus validus]|uniref:UDP-N-acetylglucosamine--N-acetylmuramyl-(pentapeptide) pyrophosphoryl-undecaprenol N-acetylglucosamine transferase n=1 Tax=Paenibacillus validus TaxID=44253 RepID=A0A7X2ZCT7_9BACL|nr:undecaprenyldiphospho-muramoylpentapeptide beta-N-acetylglucosaminyltransferase [Paenibacillus validus]MED4603721.1 undecaprenyldiphospho-muramoylpentapeptide beta-N-acetylglucosaminyltransferase [Paenibacillus validus]MED4609011.1 undecaprenyldiphospho-muramoylpentapeptide beta-N-acetylglucosaminyltransferase [Paenibacillus validus]MUG72600.1 undecaprenyldiphospho-muramoylpentapeptide beta-N-acetylglucosaminyltransferase [Paenibacillus validus]